MQKRTRAGYPGLVLLTFSLVLILAHTSPATSSAPAVSQDSFAGAALSSLFPPVLAGPCVPDSGWTWVSGPAEPAAAEEARQALAQARVEAQVQAVGFGEQDSCGSFHLAGLDYIVTVGGPGPVLSEQQDQVADLVQSVLAKTARLRLGNVAIRFPAAGITKVRREPALLPPERSPAAANPAETMNRAVYVLVFDPILANGQRLSAYMNWGSFSSLDQAIGDFFASASRGQVHYTVAATTVANEWPELVDGFRYTETQYLRVINGQALPHSPGNLNYNRYVNAPAYDICGRVNRGEIDEVWLWGAPYFGFWESTLVGPSAYWYNSPPVNGPYDCKRLTPIMGFSYERGLSEAVEDFGHRTESTMAEAYGSWQENRTLHNWDRFALVKALSPNYTYSGCGTVHYPPNGVQNYNWNNPAPVPSNCEDFASYPALRDPRLVAVPTTCTEWGCGNPGYFNYWFSHFPYFAGCGPDGVSNNWWHYIASPALALNPPAACPQYALSGTVTGESGQPVPGVEVVLAGKNRSAISDDRGTYALTGLIDGSYQLVPSKDSYIFTPVTRTVTIPPVPANQDFVMLPALTVPAQLTVTGPAAGRVGTGYPFTVTVSPVARVTPLSYKWEATDLPAVNHTELAATTDSAAFTWTAPGRKSVTITASNRAGTTVVTGAIEIYVPPAFVFITGPAAGVIDQAYSFDAAVSPPPVSPITYVWTPPPSAGQGTAHAVYRWPTADVATVHVDAANPAGSVEASYRIAISAPRIILTHLHLPLLRR